MKRYRITYNPYNRETKVEEHYDGCFPEWDVLGGENEWELNNILNQTNPIQKIGLDILEWVENHNNSIPNGSEYEVFFCGIEQDFADMQKMYDEFKRRNPNAKNQRICETAFWDNPIAIQRELEKACNDIEVLYEDDDNTELKEKLSKCMEISQAELNVLVLGVQNSGKSTLINALLGIDLLPMSGDVETAVLFTVKKNDRNIIKIITCNGEEAEIQFDGNEFKYNRSIVWLDRILDNIGNSKKIRNATTKTEQMKQVLECLNDACKSSSDASIEFKEIIVGLSDFDIANSSENFCIKDFPGAGAKYLGEEHKRIIHDEIANTINAVTVYVLKSDDVSLENVQTFLTDIKKMNLDGKNGISGQIDFEHSIYVLNKADRDKVKIDFTNAIKREFGREKVVLASAEAALQLQIRKKVDSDIKVLFVRPYEEGDELLDLQERAILPSVYTKEYIADIVDKAVMQRNNQNALKRTGMPLIAALLDEYARNFAAIHKVSCYNEALNNMLNSLKTAERKYKADVQQEKDNRIQEQDKVRNQLRDNCDTAYNDAVEKLTMTMVKSDLTEKLREMLSDINASVPDQIKKYKKDKDTKKEWKEHVSEDINKIIVEKEGDIREIVCQIMNQYIEDFKDDLLQEIKVNNVEEEELGETRALIQKYVPQKPLNSDFKIPEKFGFDRMVKDIWNAICRHTKWQINCTQEAITKYWGKTVVEHYADPLLKKTKDSYEELKTMVQEKIDVFSPELKELKKAIQDKELKLGNLQKKMEQSDAIRSKCKNIIERGRISNG